MARTDDDTWDINESVGATALASETLAAAPVIGAVAGVAASTATKNLLRASLGMDVNAESVVTGALDGLAGADLSPKLAVGTVIRGETVARADQSQPFGRGKAFDGDVRAVLVGSTAPLKADPVAGRDHHRERSA